MNKYSLNILLLIVCVSAGRTQTIENQGSYIARAGNIYISEQEFLERYELLPGQYRNRRSNVEESKIVFLYSLIAEKLLAQEAADRRFDQDPGFQVAMEGITKMLARDELYREEISGKVDVTKSEVQKAIPDARRQLSISYLYFDDSTNAAFIRRQLRNCKEFHQFQIDSSIAYIRDSSTLNWGEAEATIEKAGFHLKKGECSPVVKASMGYYILHLDKEVLNPFYDGMQINVLYERVETKLRLRKEQSRLDEYVQDVLHSKVGFSIPRTFKIVAKSLISIWKNAPSLSEQMITDSLLDVLQGHCQSVLKDSMVMVDSSCWSVQDVLIKLRGKIFKIDSSRTTGIAAQLNNHIRVLVQQELIAREALSRHMDERGSAKKDLDIWRRQVLAKYQEMEIQRKVTLSDQEIFQYISKTSPRYQFPVVQIRELHAKDLAKMDQALKELDLGIPFENIIRKYSSDDQTSQRGGLSEKFFINKRPPLGVMSWKMKIGERHGPVHISDEYIFFELVKKELPAGISDSVFEKTMHSAASALLPIKQKRVLDTFIAKTAQQRGYDIYNDRLKLIKVADVPMMTYRILGFGGRMFAAPFVTRLIDWVGIENPEKIPLP